ncbi:MAG: hypothetical protein ACFFFK_08710, partial [Candidatus Thorarchaeota archaeon]
QKVKNVLRDLIHANDSLDVLLLEKETGVDRRILRRTLIILLGEGIVHGSLSGDEFILDKNQDRSDFERKMVDELVNWSG